MSAVPKLRFPEFEGRLNASPLKEKFTHIRNGFVGTATPYYVESGVPYIQGKDIKLGSITFKNNLFVSQEFHKKYSKSALKYRDLVMVQSGHVGECAMVPESLDGSNCHALIIFTPDENVSTTWVVQFFSSQYGKKKIYKIKTGNTIEHILASDMQEMELFFPTLPEQQKIASFLSAVDKKIDLLRQKKDTLELYKKGLMQKIFSQEIRFKQDDGSDFPEWEEMRLEEIADMKAGKFIKASEISPTNQYGFFPCYGGNGLRGYVRTSNQEGRYVLIGRQGALCGNVAITTGKFYATEHAVVTRAKSGNEIDWLFYQLEKMDLNQYAIGVAQPGLSVTSLNSLATLVPSRPEQAKIASFLSTIDTKIASVASQLEQMESFKKGLLQQMFV